MESQLRRQRPRRHKMGSAESRQEVIQRRFVSHVDRRQLQAPFITVAFEQVVMPKREIKQVARRDPRGIVVVVLGVRRRHSYAVRSKLRCQARGRGQRSRRSCMHSIACKSGFKLLIGA